MWRQKKKNPTDDDITSDDYKMPEAVSLSHLLTDVEKLGIVDEHALVLTESDMNDPDLLSALSDLGNDDDPHYKSSHDDVDLPTDHHFNPSVPDFLSDDVMDYFDEPREKNVATVTKSDKPLECATSPPAAVSSLDDRLISLSEKRNSKPPPDHATELATLRKKAVDFKNAGQMTEAIAVMRKVKLLEQRIPCGDKTTSVEVPVSAGTTVHLPSILDSEKSEEPPKRRPIVQKCVSASAPPPLPGKVADMFTPLENAVIEGMSENLRLAKDLKDSMPPLAAEHFRVYKGLKEELNMIASRRNVPGATPPLFAWKITSTEVQVEDTSLADDQIRVVVEGGFGLGSTLSAHRRRSISISYSLGVVKEPPSAETPTATYNDSEGNVMFNNTQTFSFRRRGAAESMFKRKKATFDVVLHRGFFYGKVTIASARLSMEGLLTKGSIGGDISLTDTEGRKCVGGTLRVLISLRKPISGVEVRTESKRELQIGAWTDVIANGGMHGLPSRIGEPTIAPSVTIASTANDQSNSLTPTGNTTGSTTPAPLAISPVDFSSLSDLEKNDPLNVNLLISNDVLETEIENCKVEMKRAASEDDRQDINLRFMMLTGRLSVLVNQVQSGKMTLPQYIEALRARITQDKLIAVYCSKNGRKKEALRVMKRIRIMEAEVAGTADMAENDEVSDSA